MAPRAELEGGIQGERQVRRAAKAPVSAPPLPGLDNPMDDRDSCGVGFIVNLRKEKSHRIV